MITTTLRQIRQHNPCSEGWRTLLTFLGKTRVDDEPLPLTTILQSNGLDDALWCLRTLEGHDKEIIRFALACAQDVRHLMTDQRSLDALDALERHLESPLSKRELNKVVAEAGAAQAAARMAALGIHPERREPPYATTYCGGTDLPDEFVVVEPGTPACETVIGIATEPVAVVMAKAAALAVERLPLRPSCGSPDGQTAHDEAVAIDAMVSCGHCRHEYHGVVMPWWYHEMFGHAYYAAFMAARQNL